MLRRLLCLAPLCGCASTDLAETPPDGPAYAERDLPLPADGVVRIEIGDPRAADGVWTRAAIEGSDAVIARLETACFADEDSDGAVDPGETRFSYGRFQAGASARTTWARAPLEAFAGCDAVHVKVTTTAGEVETVFALGR